MIRVLIVDDHRLFRQGLISLLEDAPDIQVVGEAGDGPTAVRLACERNPDVILMDIHMPGLLNGTEATRAILRKVPGVRVLMLTVSEEDEDLFEAIRAGAQGYLLKNVDADELIEAIRQVCEGGAPLSSAMTARLITGFREMERNRSVSGHVPSLTEREMDILHLLAQGATNREIARALVLSEHTVKTHVHHILEKLGAENRAQAVARAVQWGLISPASHATRAELTKRETDILRLLAEGATNREIAHALGISEHTVKTHVHHILEKLGAENRAQAVACATQRGLLPPS